MRFLRLDQRILQAAARTLEGNRQITLRHESLPHQLEDLAPKLPLEFLVEEAAALVPDNGGKTVSHIPEAQPLLR